MKEKLVTAIITTRNRINLLKRAINSVLAQTYPNIEIIVVDDGSDDGTSAYCKDLPITYIYIPKSESKGGNYARNQGIIAAQGEYIAFLDDDDYWLPEKIEKQVYLLENKGCELVYCGRKMEIVTKKGIKYTDLLPDSLLQGNMQKKILFSICCTTSTILVKKSALTEVGLFDEKLGFWQEYELTIRLAQRKPFYYVNDPLSVYRVNNQDTQRLTNKYHKWKKAVHYIYKKHAILYAQLNPIEKLQVYILYLGDATIRCKNAGLITQYYLKKINWLILSLPFRLINRTRKIIQQSKRR